MAGAALGEVQVSLFVAGAALGEVQVSLFVAGAALGEVAVSFFVAGAALGDVLGDCLNVRLGAKRGGLGTDGFILGSCLDHGRIILRSALKRMFHLFSKIFSEILECHFS